MFYHLQNDYTILGYRDSGESYRKGKVDMALILDQGCEKYLAYECKCLNVLYKNGKKDDLARKYVSDGLKRFVTEKYAKNLPVGCMLGYVMDGDAETAERKVRKAIDNRKECISLAAAPTSEQPLGTIRRFSSRHKRATNQQEIEIRHALLPFRNQARQKKATAS